MRDIIQLNLDFYLHDMIYNHMVLKWILLILYNIEKKDCSMGK